MKKTFYSVKYRNIGDRQASIEWFDNLEELEKFVIKQDGADRRIRHTYRKPESIKKAEKLVKERKQWAELVKLERAIREAAILGEEDEEKYYYQKMQQIIEKMDKYENDEETKIRREDAF